MKKKRIAVCMLLTGLALSAIGAIKLAEIQKSYESSRVFYAEAQNEYARVRSEAGTPQQQAEQSDSFWQKLRGKNKDIYAWLSMPAVGVDYPVLQGENNDAYLRRLPDGTYNNGGSLFVDERCSPDFSDPVTVIYGHYMRNGTMFGQLNRYGDSDFLRQHPQFTLDTPGGTITPTVLACIEVQKENALYDLPAREELPAYLAACAESTGVDLSGFSPDTEGLLLLSTCTKRFDSSRTVVIASFARDKH